MSVLVYDCGSVENTVTAILDTESGAMIIRGNGDIDNYADESSPWYSEHSDILQVTVDKGITRIGSGTFYGCENLSFVEIANTVTSIGADVFQNCTSLTSIKIPKSITEIGNGTFADSGLTDVKLYGNPPTVGTDIFDGVTADVYTPEGNEEWTETAKGTVAGNGSNLTWKEFDSKPNLIEYDELDYLWSKIKKYVDNNVSVTQVVSSGTKIATITINGVATDIYSSSGLSGTVGNKLKPIYIDNGVPTECDDLSYPTGEILNLSAKGLTTESIAITNGVIDSSGYGNHGQAYGGVNITTDKNFGQCFNFDGTDDYIDLSSHVHSFENINGFTAYIIFNPSSTQTIETSTCLFAILLGSSYMLGLQYQPVSQTLSVISRTESSSQESKRIDSTTVIDTDTFIKVTVVLDFTLGKIKLYLNENLDSEIDGYNIPISASLQNFAIGAKLNNTSISQQFTGIISNLIIYQRVLTESEIKTLLTLGSKSTYAGVAYFATSANTAATATTAESCSGNAATATTATNANNLKVTHTGAAWRDILSCATGFTSASNQAVYGHNSGSMAYYVDANATSGNQRAILRLGNATVNTTAAGHNGLIWMYGTNTGYTEIKPGHNSTGSITVTLPSTTGTIALEKTGSVPIYYVEGPSTDTTAGTWTGSITGLTAYYDGLTILYVPAVAGANPTTLNINNLGAVSCYYTNTSVLTTHYSVGTPILLTYRDNAWRRADYNSNTTYSAMSVAEGTAGTATNSRTMRADYLKQIIAALPSASCTGASASCTGNAASSTYTSNIRVAKNTASAWYPLVFVTGSTANTNYAPKYHPGLNVDCYDGTTSANGYCFLQLGTATAYGTAGNAYGGIYLYKKATSTYKTPKRVIIVPPNVAAATDADVTLTLPNTTGTIALTSSSITGNAATATTATNATITPRRNNNTWYPIVFAPSATTAASGQSLLIASVNTTAGNSILAFDPYTNPANASTRNPCYLQIGNGIAYNNADNYASARRGVLRLYGDLTYYAQIDVANGYSANRTFTFPVTTANGNIVTSTSSTKVNEIQVVASLPASPNANTMYLVTS